MPWNESNRMDERVKFVARLLDGEKMSVVCREFGISRKTGYKIFNRYKDFGLVGLQERSSRPLRYANQLPFQVEKAIVQLKQDHTTWGAPKIREKLIRNFPTIKPPAKSYVFGLLAGVLGGAYAFRGIVFGIYGSLRGWSPAQFKGAIHSFFLISGIFIPFGYFGAGLVTPRVIGLFFVMMPVALLATLVGTWYSGKLKDETFQKVIWSVLLVLGIFFVMQFFLQNLMQFI